MTQHRVARIEQDNETLYELCNPATGAYARIWPDFGNNCLEARLPAPDGRLVDLLLAPDSPATLREHASGWGNPLLFPSPSRIRGGEYRFQGRSLRMPGGDAKGNVMHGFALRRSWRVENVEAGGDHATLTCSFSSDDHPDTLEGFPFPYRVVIAYRLQENGLTMDVEVRNTGDGPLPFGFGAHPYFRIPFSNKGRREDCRIVIPAAERWDLNVIADVRGRDRLSRAEAVRPVGEGLDYRTPLALETHLLDDVVTGLACRDGWVECAVTDPESGIEGVMQATDSFQTVVVYTPPKRPGLCFEPWTCPPNALNLHALGVEGNGLIVLDAGMSWKGSMRVFLRPAK